MSNPIQISNLFSRILSAHQIVIEDIPEKFCHDFANLTNQKPKAVLFPKDEMQLSAVVKELNTLNLSYSFRATGNSLGGYSLSEGGIIVQLPEINDSKDLVIIDNTVRVYTGQTWATVEDKLNKKGFTFPVLTNFLGATIGGTLSAGGFGIRSVNLGPQVDQVKSIRLILKNGTVQEVGPKDEAFRLALTGMGKMGIISSALVSVIPFKPVVKLYTSTYQSLTDFIKHFIHFQKETYSQVDLFWADYNGKQLVVNIGRLYNSNMEGMFSKLPGDISLPDDRVIKMIPYHSLFDRTTGPYQKSQSYLWNDFGIPAKNLEAFLNFIEAVILPETKSILNRVYILPIAPKNKPPFFPFDIRNPENESMTYGVGIYFQMKNQKEIDLAMSKRKQLLAQLAEFEGRPYLPGFPESTISKLHPAYLASLSAYEKIQTIT